MQTPNSRGADQIYSARAFSQDKISQKRKWFEIGILYEEQDKKIAYLQSEHCLKMKILSMEYKIRKEKMINFDKEVPDYHVIFSSQ